jgi:hypothetical protein
VKKENIFRKILIGKFRLFFYSLAFSFVWGFSLLSFSLNFKLAVFIYFLANIGIIILFFLLLHKKIEAETSDVVSDYIFTYWIPLVVAFLTSLPYSIYLFYTTPLKEVIPTTDVLGYLLSLMHSEVLKKCQILGHLSVFIVMEEYLLWVAIISLKQLGNFLTKIAILILLIKNGIAIWTINRLIIATIIILWRLKEKQT